MTDWDVRALFRAFGAVLVALAVVWLVTAASDEGQLTVGVRAGRTLPLAPLCSAVGAALALASTRIAGEARALEALGRSPAENVRAVVLGAALPSILVALVIAATARVDVSAFYPRPPRGDVFVREEGAFTSPTLGVRVADVDGEPRPAATTHVPDDEVPRGARASAASATALAGIALSLLAAGAMLRRSLEDAAARRRRRIVALVRGTTCAFATLVAFQIAAARAAPAVLALVPPLALLAVLVFEYRFAHERAR